MKKTLSVLLALCMIGAIGAGCSSSETSSSSEAPRVFRKRGFAGSEKSFEGVTLRFAPVWALTPNPTWAGKCSPRFRKDRPHH